ncbi:1-deoxy-D-xylulose-5-phosphate reductoisomerase [Butyricicoccus porcorum]|uniref:1-deoxy-D-xylulose 5-phosphate reductoisomerase n=1 Tax=Butyricicoccus porcorum TaxID=1945634 RepID=A0A252F6B2_9FIRM|nr:1-deoxy-D-xylulose-5-phosphate reductoisomerase [Butyricicoccus porcorum]MCI6925979.1 1-deoxy-D-xylulose-5-phosphate reductoisomerase [Butyricicoccus porcorum]MDD6985782.1 1-deoxy-D-xylulose-5-phosphate reductoisomerase [Butyricicoccus porcorum]MDY4484180.1 1-deoxy-D-xylulose-5-phosphate reductoisomerase [Butyricicoccus porcorum]OUM21296.1 1-deoxy-D-xylulose-5-phosphate reductoisomerase [Butyricicoccus porcorum]
MKNIVILGSTGSIGTQTVDILDSIDARVCAISVNTNIVRAEEQARLLHPSLVAVYDAASAAELAKKLADTDIRVVSGMDGLIEAATLPEADVVVTAVVGMVGLLPTIAAIDAGKDIALANKETLVCAGQIVMQRARDKDVAILPVDSEHSAIFQCLQGAAGNRLSRILLTASGGPFFGMSAQQLRHVTKEQALRHPNWSMGAKITIDSASMMNKGLELIEAMWLYDVEPDDIDIVVHRESIVHSAVEFEDGSVIAQLGNPDMRLPIQYALTYPQRVPCKVPPLDLPRRHNLTFFAPDEEAFPALGLARRAAAARGNLGAVMNGANEAAVDLFLHDRIPFYRIPELVRGAMDAVDYLPEITVDDVLESDRAAREVVYSLAE